MGRWWRLLGVRSQAALTSAGKSSQKRLDMKTTRVVGMHTLIGDDMAGPKLAKLELQIMETLWTRGEASIREIQDAFTEKNRPAYTTVQTTVYRLEGKKAEIG